MTTRDDDRTLRDEVEIQALLDGELAPEAAARLRARIATDPRLQAIEAELRDLIGDCAMLFSATDARAAAAVPPPRLEVVRGDAPPAPVVRRAPARRSWTRSPALRAAAVVFVVAGASLVLGRGLGERLASREGEAPARVATGETPASPGAPRGDVAGRPATPGLGGSRGGAPATGTPGGTGTGAADPVTGVAPGVTIVAQGLRQVGAREDVGGDPAGTQTWRTGDGAALTLEYGARAVAAGGQAVDAPGTPARVTTPAGVGPLPGGTNALGGRDSARGAAPAGSCPGGIRWRDASGVEMRLAGPYGCEQLREIAARFRVVRRAP